MEAELDQPWIENLLWCAPGSPVDAVDGANAIGIQRVVRIDVDLKVVVVEPDVLGQPQVEPGDPGSDAMDSG